MHAQQLLHKFLEQSCGKIHQKRRDTLELLTLTSIKCTHYSQASLARDIPSKASEKARIKQVNRFVSNEKLWEEKHSIYAATCRLLLSTRRQRRQILTGKRPLVIVDWSEVPNTEDCHVIRAAVAAEGRAITLYEEVYPHKQLGSQTAHRSFLQNLKKLLPDNCKPILITDAGFHSTWFKLVTEFGWDWVSRVRILTKYQGDPEKGWEYCQKHYAEATEVPRLIGMVMLSKKNPVECNMAIYKGKNKDRVDRTRKGMPRRDTKSRDCARGSKEPWLLVTSLKDDGSLDEKIVKIYTKRMQIEEGFRDLKSSKFGFGFEHSLTEHPRRIEILLLIVMLASLVLFLVGLVTEMCKKHYSYQANTIKHRRVLSLVFLGRRVLSNNENDFPKRLYVLAVRYLQENSFGLVGPDII